MDSKPGESPQFMWRHFHVLQHSKFHRSRTFHSNIICDVKIALVEPDGVTVCWWWLVKGISRLQPLCLWGESYGPFVNFPLYLSKHILCPLFLFQTAQKSWFFITSSNKGQAEQSLKRRRNFPNSSNIRNQTANKKKGNIFIHLPYIQWDAWHQEGKRNLSEGDRPHFVHSLW